MTPEQFDVLVNVAAAVLLAGLFLGLVAAAVALALVWQALRSARRALPGFMADAAYATRQIEDLSYDTAAAALGRPIALLSTWRGVMAGARAFGGRRPRSGARAGSSRPEV